MKRITCLRLALVILSLATVTSSLPIVCRAAQNSKQQRDRGQAAIVGSGAGSENGFRILVDRRGKTQSTMVPRGPMPQPVELPIITAGKIPAELAKRIYSDIDAAWPLSALPKQSCTKDASSGAALTIEFDYQATPDLSCGNITEPKLRKLAEDAHEILKASSKAQTGGH